jgi:rubredoxin
MRSDRIRGYCPQCRHAQLFERTEVHHGVHFLLSIVTLGLWTVSWISIVIGHRLHPWRCLQCGWRRPQAIEPSESGGLSAKEDKTDAKRA